MRSSRLMFLFIVHLAFNWEAVGNRFTGGGEDYLDGLTDWLTDWLSDWLTGSWKRNNAKSVTRRHGNWVAHLHWVALLPAPPLPRPLPRPLPIVVWLRPQIMQHATQSGGSAWKWKWKPEMKSSQAESFHLQRGARWAMGDGRWAVGGAVIVVAIGGQLQPQKQKQLKRLQAAGLKGGVGQEPPTAPRPSPSWPWQFQLKLRSPVVVVGCGRICSAKVQGQRCCCHCYCCCCSYCMHFAEITLTSGRDRDGESGASEMERIKHTRLANKARY